MRSAEKVRAGVRGDRRAAVAVVLAAIIGLGACSSIQTVRVQPESVHVGPNLRAIAVIHAQVSSFYVLFIPIPGKVGLDRVVNRMLLATAKALGADKVVNIRVDITPDGGIWTLRKVLGWRSAEASGIAVVVEPAVEPAGDPASSSTAPAVESRAPSSAATPKSTP
ncbi:MAG: hypothetical protein M3680_07530 [Myxococcota bacterium]|nr:hypothetical protein [Myxococcota bacterium]